MSTILGISPHFINNASALVLDGNVIYACEEERLNRQKKTRRFPLLSVKDGLSRNKMNVDDVDICTISVNAGIYLENLSTVHSSRLRHRGEVLYSVPNYLMSIVEDNSVKASRQEFEFFNGKKIRIEWVEHHLAHAASSFFLSPYETAAILSMDGFGEKTTVMFARGKGNRIEPFFRLEFPHSLGMLYSTLTEFLGFIPHSDEWKVMGAAPYGDSSRFYKKIKKLIHLKSDGAFELDLSYFNFFQFHRPLMYSRKLIQHFGVAPNKKDGDLDEVYCDIAAATQTVTEEVIMHMLKYLHARTGEDNLCLAGGIAFNSVANGKIVSHTPFKRLFIPPMPDDSGTSVGSSLYVYHQLQGNPRKEGMSSNYWGPGYTSNEIALELNKWRVPYREVNNPAEVGARLISQGKIIGWFQGRLEFGDRALGNRSILADPRDPAMKDKVNAKIKYRERFRPFAPSILEKYLDEYFMNAAPTPFMEKVFPIRGDKREEIPAVTHVDGSGRLHTVTREQNERFYLLIEHFHKLSNIPVVLNTSFNLKGEPIVCSPSDAIRTFFTSGMDALLLNNCLVTKDI